MVFSSLLFMFIFFPITIVLYFIAPKKLRNIVMLIVSLIFYAWGEPIYIFLMLFSAVFDFINGKLIYKFKDNKRNATIVLLCSLTVNLSMLCFFKYYGFLLGNVNTLFNLHIEIHTLPLPLGISFYTFQSMSYIIDVYRGIVPAQKNFISYATYVAMFPQLIAGPIVKYRDIYKEIDERKESLSMFGDGVECFITGLGKKVLLANNIGILWTTIKASPVAEVSVLSAWIGIIAFTFQIYFDFSGYSDMAIGLAKMFGFKINKNFDYPYTSKSITEFWRRWHISLGSWFREYVYIPLGGNRTTRLKRYRNIFIVWFLTGMWHGASWNFIIWGLYYGIFVTIEKIFLSKWLEKRPAIISHIYTMLIVTVGWALFEFDKTPQLFSFLKVMFGLSGNHVFDTKVLYYLYTNAVIFIIMILCATPLPKRLLNFIKHKYQKISAFIVPVMYFAIMFICTAYLVNQSYNPFLYFRF